MGYNLLNGLIVLMVFIVVSTPLLAGQTVDITPSVGFSARQFYLWTLGLSLDFYPVNFISITPELYISNKHFSFTPYNDENMYGFRPTYLLQPGLMINYHQPRLLAGAGVVYSNEARHEWHYIRSEVPRTQVEWETVWRRVWHFKLNMGFKLKNIRMTVAFLHPFKDIGWFPRSIDRTFSLVLGYTF
jgi:hypothetical protein